MKKLLLSLVALLATLGAWADVTPLKVSTDAQKYYYVIKSLRTGKYAYYNGDNAQLLQQVNPTSATEQGTLNKYLWYVTEAPGAGDGAYMLHNVATTKVYAAYNSFTDEGAVVYIKENPYRDGYVCVSNNANATTSKSCWDDQDSHTKIGPYEPRETDNEGTSWSFIEIESQNANVNYTLNDNVGHEFSYSFTGWNMEMLPFVEGVVNYTLSTPVFDDKIVTATINFPFHVSSAENVNKVMISSFNSETRKWYAAGTNIKTVTDGNATRENVDAHMWNIYPQFADGKFTFKIKNYSTNTFIKHNGTTDNHTDKALSLATEIEASAFTWEANNRFQVVGTNQFLSTESSSTPDQYLGTHYSTGHNGSKLSIFNPYYYSDVTLKDECGTIHDIKNCKINEAQDEPTFTGADGYTLTDKVWDGNTLTATINFPVPVSSAEVTNQAIISTYSTAGTNKYFADGTAVKANRDNTMPFAKNVDAVNYLWAFYPSYNNGAFKFKIKNIGTGTYISSDVAENDHSGNEVSLVDDEESNALLFTITSYKQIRNNKGYDLSVGSSTGDAIKTVGTYNSNHNGTKNKIICANNYTLTLSDGSKYVGTNGVQNLMNSNYTFTNGAWNEVNGYTANINFAFPFPVSSETVANPILIGQGTWDGANSFEKLWKVVDGNVKVVDGTPYLGTSLWLIYPTLTGSEFTYKIKSVSTDKYVTANLASGNDAEANNTPITLTSTGTEFRYQATTCGSDKGFAYTNANATAMYLTRNGSDDNDKLLGVHQAKDTHKGNGIRFPEFTEYNVTIGETGYTTLYSPFTAITVSEDLKIYTITSAPQNSTVTLNLITNPQADEVSNYVYEEQGVIINGNPGTYTFSLLDDENYYDAEDWTNNLLKGSVTNTYVQGDAYVLSAPGGVENVGLYKAELNKGANGEDGDTHFLNNAGKAYLPVANGNAARFLSFDFGTETAIESVEAETATDAVVYDLAGRRVKAAQKGLYIVNGKVVIK